MIAPESTLPLVPMLLYIGPDVFMPLLSALAAVFGVLLMFWRRVTGLFGRVVRRLSGQSVESPPDEPGAPRS